MALVICLSLAYAAGFAAYALRDQIPRAAYGNTPETRAFWEAWQRIEDHFYGTVPSARDRTYGALHASLQLLDSDTVFVEPAASEHGDDTPGDSHSEEGIERAALRWYMVTSKTGCVRLDHFNRATSTQLVRAVEDLERLGASGLVLDLRDNASGPLQPATLVAAQFLSESYVVFYQKRSTHERAFRAPDGGNGDLPLAVLINGGTGSAAEVVAGALQAHGRAALIGEPSSGEGSVQEVHALSDGSSLHITAAVLLTPDRHQIDGRGLAPDILIRYSDGPGDEQLERAVVYLESEL